MVKVCKYLPSLVEIKHYDAHVFVKFSRKLGITTPKRAKKCCVLLAGIHSFYTLWRDPKAKRLLRKAKRLPSPLANHYFPSILL